MPPELTPLVHFVSDMSRHGSALWGKATSQWAAQRALDQRDLPGLIQALERGASAQKLQARAQAGKKGHDLIGQFLTQGDHDWAIALWKGGAKLDPCVLTRGDEGCLWEMAVLRNDPTLIERLSESHGHWIFMEPRPFLDEGFGRQEPREVDALWMAARLGRVESVRAILPCVEAESRWTLPTTAQTSLIEAASIAHQLARRGPTPESLAILALLDQALDRRWPDRPTRVEPAWFWPPSGSARPVMLRVHGPSLPEPAAPHPRPASTALDEQGLPLDAESLRALALSLRGKLASRAERDAAPPSELPSVAERARATPASPWSRPPFFRS